MSAEEIALREPLLGWERTGRLALAMTAALGMNRT